MQLVFNQKRIAFLTLLSAFLFLHYSTSHPTNGSGGYTGAPGDQACLTCHNTGSINGNLQITGIPSVVDPGETYPITVTINNTVGTAVRAGFQMVTLRTSTNTNSGTYSIPSSELNALVKTANFKSYAGHKNAKSFDANTVTYEVEWTAPTTQDGEEIRFYGAALIANGSGTSGDRFVTTNVTSTIAGGAIPITISFTDIEAVTCNGTADGTAEVLATGGTGSYNYAWDNGETDAMAVALSAGTHTVTVTDSNSDSKIGTVEIPDALPIVSGIASETDVSCFGGSDGQAQIQASGGTGSLTYQWSNGLSGSQQNTLQAGTYTVTVSDQNNCESIVNLDIDEPELLAINLGNVSLPSCSDSENGSIATEVLGGVPPYVYNWTPNIGVQAGGSISNIPAGDYTVELIDDNDCTTSLSVTLTAPAPVIVTFTDVADESCQGANDGSALAEVLGSSGPYTFQWSNGNTAALATNLAPGSYTVTVTDQDGCTNSAEIDINQGGLIEVELIVINEPTCGNDQGELFANILQGSVSYFNWSTGNNTDESISGLSAGIYGVTVSDINGCTDEATSILLENNDITASITESTNVTCGGMADGTATLAASGGQEPYSFTWSDGGQSSERFDLSAGMFVITVTDQQGCSTILMLDITEPEPISVQTDSLTTAGCQPTPLGFIAISADGGTGNLSYLWSTGDTTSTISSLPAGSYICTISDEGQCHTTHTVEVLPESDLEVDVMASPPLCADVPTGNISIVVQASSHPNTITWADDSTIVSFTRENLPPNFYSFTITDGVGCSFADSIEIINPTQVLINLTTTSESDEGLSDGTATVAPTGGEAPYQVFWSTGMQSLAIANLAPGAYAVTVVDSHGCFVEEDFTISSFGCDLTGSISMTANPCSNDSLGVATISPMNGTPPYTLLWSTGDTTDTITNLPSGSYTVTLSDNAGCMLTFPVEIDAPLPIAIEYLTTSPYEGQENGSISLTVSGGTTPYRYLWSSGDTTTSLQNVIAGSYSVSIVDANNCQTDTIITLVNIPCIDSVIVDQSPFACYGRSESIISVVLNSGDSITNYAWNDGSSDIVLDSIPAGNYQVTLTSSTGCVYESGEIIIVENPEIDITNLVITDESSAGSADGSISVLPVGGTAPYTYQWFDESNNVISTAEVLTGATAGTFYLCVTDSLLCNNLFGPLEISIGTYVEESIAENISIFPNPTSSDIYIEIENMVVQKVELLDLQGHVLRSMSPAGKVIKLSTSNYHDGLYIISISTSDTTLTRKVQITK